MRGSAAKNYILNSFSGKRLERFDSFCLPARISAAVEAVEDCVFSTSRALATKASAHPSSAPATPAGRRYDLALLDPAYA